MRLACRMNVKNETARILRAHAERAASANALVKIYFKLYKIGSRLTFSIGLDILEQALYKLCLLKATVMAIQSWRISFAS